MDGDLIKSFLVGLGFGVDDASLSKFNKSIASATLKVTALYASIKVTSAAILYGISKISEGFEQMGYEYHIIAPAINKALLLRRELLKAYTAAGINIRKVVKDSINLNLSLTKTRYAFEAIYKSVASRFFEAITKQSDIFRNKIYANLPKIQNYLERFVKFIFKALDATTQLGIRLWSILGRVYTFLKDLDEATSGWSTKLLALVAIWQAFNLSFLATPLGILFSLGVAILALYDDFKTFQEGGKTFFNWTTFIPVINGVKDALQSLLGVLRAISETIGNVVLAFTQLFRHDWRSSIDSLTDASKNLLNVWSHFLDVFQKVDSLGAHINDWILNTLGLQNTALQGVFGSHPPLGTQGSNSQTNQNVKQQTTINMTGVPDAAAAGKAVAGEQKNVNFDLVRNLRGSVRPGGVIP